MENSLKEAGFAAFKRLGKEHVKKYIPRLILVSILMIISAAAVGVQPLLLQLAFDKIFEQKNTTYLILIPIAVIGVFVVQAIALYFSGYILNKFSFKLIADLKKNLFSHIMKFELDFYSKNNSGELLSRIVNELSYVSKAVVTIFSSIRQALSAVALIGNMFYQSVTLSIISLTAFAIAFYPLARIAVRLKKIGKQTNIKTGDFTARVLESLNGIRVVKAYGKEAYETEKMYGYMDEITKLATKSAKISGITAPMMQILAGLAVAFVIWFGGMQLIDGQMTQGNLIAFITSLLMAARPIRSLSGTGGAYVNGLVAIERYYEIIDLKPTQINGADGFNLKVNNAEIKLENISFNYPDGTLALKNINLTMEAGKKTALVGHSGSGKSTIFNLLMKFYSPTQGKIIIDSADISCANVESVRQNIALVSQDIFIFDDTALNNIGYGREGASKDEIIAAAKAAKCHDFIMSLPNGYDTKLGFFGEKLSGGQKQRISIARAFLRNSPILLLDEATSALDPKTEAEIQAALDDLTKNRTTIVIAHRLSTVIKADKMVLLHGGEVAATGTHEQLQANNEQYRSLFGL